MIRGDRGPEVRQLQRALIILSGRLGLPSLSPGAADGIYGQHTEAAVAAWSLLRDRWRPVDQVPRQIQVQILAEAELSDLSPAVLQPPAALPPICAWVDRRGVLEPGVWADEAAELGLDRVALFLVGLEKTWRPFVSSAGMVRAVDTCEAHGLEVDLTVWVRPSRTWLEAVLAYVGPLLGSRPALRLDLDTEAPWAGGSGHRAHARWFWRELWTRYRVGPDRVSVNDYALLQKPTQLLLEEGDALAAELGLRGPRRRAQCYSVGYVTHGDVGPDGKRWTKPGSTYYPGETQRIGGARWRPSVGRGVLDMGLAVYKPVEGLTPAEQVRLQVEAALEQNPAELWFWQLAMARPYRAALTELTARAHRAAA